MKRFAFVFSNAYPAKSPILCGKHSFLSSKYPAEAPLNQTPESDYYQKTPEQDKTRTPMIYFEHACASKRLFLNFSITRYGIANKKLRLFLI